jgi:hypothetical protein
MLAIENVRKHSLVDVSYDPDLVPVLVEVYRTGRVRPLERATAGPGPTQRSTGWPWWRCTFSARG